MPGKINSQMSGHAWLLLLLLSLVWGGSFYFNAILVAELSTLAVVFLRVALAAVVLWIYVFMKKIPVPSSATAWTALLTMGLLNNVIPFLLIVWGQTQISSSLASILNATAPIITVFLAATLLADENITKLKLTGAVIGFIGTVWIIAPQSVFLSGGNLLAQLAVLGAAVSYSFASVFGRRFSSMEIHPVTVAAGQVTGSTILMFPLFWFAGSLTEMQMPSMQAMLALLGLAIFSTALAYILYFRILAMAGATNLVLVTFLIPFWAMLFGFMLLNESLSMMQVTGVLILAIGLILIDGRLFQRK